MSSYARFEADKLVELLDTTETLSTEEGWVSVPFFLVPFVNTDYVKNEEGHVAPPSPDYLERQIFAKLAELRWEKQSLGLKYDGTVYQSDNASIELMRSKAETADATFLWKSKDGFVELTTEKARLVYNGLIVARDHLFWYESDVQAQIKAAEAYTVQADQGEEITASWFESKILTWFRLSQSSIWDEYNPASFDYKSMVPESVPMPASEALPQEDAGFRKRLADFRYAQQVMGVKIDGVTYHSAPEDLNILASTIQLGERFEATNGPGTWTTVWKAKSGFVDHTVTSLMQVAMLLAGYTQACFAHERAVLEQYDAMLAAEETDAEKLETIALAIEELGEGWPVAEFTTTAGE